ncbi:MAG: 3'-5' exoribonuclease [Burkholderiales bacterium]|jgi:DNA polymerase III epsilon subunit-like protein|nr:3'-5' exoribonuclease [Burkholderiales bacterium]
MIANRVHYVLDLETLGTRDDAIIASIGIVLLEGGLQADCFYTAINTEQQGRSFDEETLDWWDEDAQDEARAEFIPEDEVAKAYMPTLDKDDVLRAVDAFINESPHAPIWGNGSDFDNRILGNAFRQHGMEWPYSRNACLRTLRHIVGGERYTPPVERIKHIAINDAMNEAEELLYLLSRIKVVDKIN